MKIIMKFILTYLFNTFFILGFLNVLWFILDGTMLPEIFLKVFFPCSLVAHILFDKVILNKPDR